MPSDNPAEMELKKQIADIVGEPLASYDVKPDGTVTREYDFRWPVTDEIMAALSAYIAKNYVAKDPLLRMVELDARVSSLMKARSMVEATWNTSEMIAWFVREISELQAQKQEASDE